MTRKKLMVMSVAAACAAPMIAHANWEVMTPSSVDESAPQLTVSRSHPGTGPASVSTQADTPFASTGTAAYGAQDTTLSAAELRARQARARTASLPNPQTPWSPSESGSNNYSQDIQTYRQHVASLEQARTVAAASYAPLIAIAEAPPPAPETPVASAADASAPAVDAVARTEAQVPRADTPVANTPVANAEASAEVDRLLKNTDAPQDRPREAVATMSPMLVDTRAPAASELRVESTGNEGPSGSAGDSAMQQGDASAHVGGTRDAASVASVAGSSGSITESSVGQAPTASSADMAAPSQATSTPPETAAAAAQARSGTTAQ